MLGDEHVAGSDGSGADHSPAAAAPAWSRPSGTADPPPPRSGAAASPRAPGRCPPPSTSPATVGFSTASHTSSSRCSSLAISSVTISRNSVTASSEPDWALRGATPAGLASRPGGAAPPAGRASSGPAPGRRRSRCSPARPRRRWKERCPAASSGRSASRSRPTLRWSRATTASGSSASRRPSSAAAICSSCSQLANRVAFIRASCWMIRMASSWLLQAPSAIWRTSSRSTAFRGWRSRANPASRRSTSAAAAGGRTIPAPVSPSLQPLHRLRSLPSGEVGPRESRPLARLASARAVRVLVSVVGDGVTRLGECCGHRRLLVWRCYGFCHIEGSLPHPSTPDSSPAHVSLGYIAKMARRICQKRLEQNPDGQIKRTGPYCVVQDRRDGCLVFCSTPPYEPTSAFGRAARLPGWQTSWRSIPRRPRVLSLD